MSRPARAQMPTDYQLRVDGHLDDHWSPWFEHLTLTHETDGTTSLRGPVLDQAQLHGLLVKVRDLGLTLISVEPVDPSPPTHPAPQGPPHEVGSGDAHRCGGSPRRLS